MSVVFRQELQDAQGSLLSHKIWTYSAHWRVQLCARCPFLVGGGGGGLKYNLTLK